MVSVSVQFMSFLLLSHSAFFFLQNHLKYETRAWSLAAARSYFFVFLNT